MGAFTETIPSFLNGVTQQPQQLRRSSQGERQVNCRASPADGLGKRRSSRHLAKLSGDRPTHPFRHTINRDATERYAVYVADGAITVYDLINRTTAPVATPDGTAYLSDPEGYGFSAVTVKDTTFIANRGVAIQMDPEVTPSRPPEALVSVKAGNYGKTYRILINGTERAQFITGNGGSASHSTTIATDHIAEQLVLAFNAFDDTATPPAMTATQYGSDIYIATDDGVTDFEIEVEDGFAGQNMTVVKTTTNKFADLPSKAPEGVVVKVLGDTEREQDDYYVKYAPPEENGLPVWEESVGPGVPFKLDPSTMPHVLVREADGTFTFRQQAWGDREVGDGDSNPEPGFVGKRPNHVFYHRNRLGILAGGNLVTSRGGGETFSFWRSTTMTVVDTDPIDVTSSGADVAILLDTVDYNEDLVVRSTKGQYVLKGEPLLTPKETSLRLRSSYETSPKAGPVVVGNKAMGDKVYMPFTRGSHAGLWELSILKDTTSNLADDVTEHVPAYIEGEFICLAGSAVERLVVGITDAEPNVLQVYEFLWSDNAKLQASWSKWTLGATDILIDVEFIGSTLLVTYVADDGVYLDELDVTPGRYDSEGRIIFTMDRRVSPAGVYDGTHTTWTLPYACDDDLWVVHDADWGVYRRGMIITHDRPSSTTVRASGDFSGATVAIGRKVVSEYELSRLFLRQQGGNGSSIALLHGRTQVFAITFHLASTGYLEAHVTPRGRSTRVKKFTGKTLGALTATLGQTTLEDQGELRVRVGAKNTDAAIVLKSDHFLPFYTTGASWEGAYTHRNR